MFINQLVAGPLSRFLILTGTVIWTLVTVQCFEWLPFDLGEAVRIFSVSYNAHVVASPHDHASEIADNLFQTLINPRYKSPLFDYENGMLGQM